MTYKEDVMHTETTDSMERGSVSDNFIVDMIKKIYDKSEQIDNKVSKVEVHLQKLNGQQHRNTLDIQAHDEAITSITKYHWKLAGGIATGMAIAQFSLQYFL